jgi:hypothetical protein
MIRTPSHPSSTPPILFLHGLGLGLTQYYSLLSHLLEQQGLKDRTILVPMQPHISQDVFARGWLQPERMSGEALAAMVEGVLGDEGRKGVTCLSHSK